MEGRRLYDQVYVQCPECLFSESVDIDKNGEPVDVSLKLKYVPGFYVSKLFHRPCDCEVRVWKCC